MRVLAYARVSSTEQGERGTSLEGQQQEFHRYCRSKGWPDPVVYVEIESGGAAAEERRVEQARLLRDVRRGDVILVAKQDRWTRHALYYLRTVEALQASGARLVSIAEAWDVSDPAGKTAAGMMALFAEQEHARIKERTVGTRRRLRAQGFFVEGPPPLGYDVDRKARKLVPNANTAPLVRKMFAMAADGLSTREIALELSREWPDVPGLDYGAIARRLRSRAYIGELAIEGQRGRGARPNTPHVQAHEPIVEASVWHRVQRALESRRMTGRKPGEQTANYLLRGLIQCGHCGYACRVQVSGTGASVRHDGWYGCVQCDLKPRVRRDRFDAMIEAAILVRLEELAVELERVARRPASQPVKDDRAPRRAALVARRTRLLEAIEDGTITRDVARERMAALTTAIEALDVEVRPTPTRTREDLLAEAARWRSFAQAWADATMDSRRGVAARVIDAIVLFRSGEKWTRGGWVWGIRWASQDS